MKQEGSSRVNELIEILKYPKKHDLTIQGVKDLQEEVLYLDLRKTITDSEKSKILLVRAYIFFYQNLDYKAIDYALAAKEFRSNCYKDAENLIERILQLHEYDNPTSIDDTRLGTDNIYEQGVISPQNSNTIRVNRINRGSFAMSYITALFTIILGYLADIILYNVTNTEFETRGLGLPITQLLAIIINIYQVWIGVLRLHDRGRRGWEIAIAFIPIIGLIVIIPNFFEKGVNGQNKYGAPQKETRVYFPFD